MGMVMFRGDGISWKTRAAPSPLDGGGSGSLYEHPANLCVASFIGSPEINLWEGALEGGALMLGSQRLALPAGPAPRAGERVTFTIDTSRLCFFDPDTGQAIR
jgi:hypothetical protein